jgi:hypothetical protein
MREHSFEIFGLRTLLRLKCIEIAKLSDHAIRVNTGSTDYERVCNFVYEYSSLLGKKCQKVETRGVHISSWCLLYYYAYLIGVYVYLLYMRTFCCRITLQL